MNQQQAREIADRALQRWASDDEDKRLSTDVICDALHAAFEAERVLLERDAPKPLVIHLDDEDAERFGTILKEHRSEIRPVSPDRAAARLASIKETARRMYASGQCGEVFDIIMNQAESFENAFERRYGGGR